MNDYVVQRAGASTEPYGLRLNVSLARWIAWSNAWSSLVFMFRHPSTTFSLHLKYSPRRSSDQSAGGLTVTSRMLQILSAIFSCFARTEDCAACSI